MTAKYSLDHYHFNVGQGDGAIHILSLQPPPGSTDKPTILQASLLDGGTGKGKDMIEDVQGFIREHYKKFYKPYGDAPDYVLKFDSLVISHWDDDHYSGVLQLVLMDFMDCWTVALGIAETAKVAYNKIGAAITTEEKAFALKYLGTGAHPDDSDAIKQEVLMKQLWDEVVQVARALLTFITGWRCRLFHYGPRRTAMYAPNWNADAESYEVGTGFFLEIPTAGKLEAKKTRMTQPPGKKHKPPPSFSIAFVFSANSTAVNSLDIRWGEISWKVKTKTGTTVKGPDLYYWQREVCKLYYEPQDVLGRDILTNEAIDTNGTSYNTISDRWKLTKAHQLTNPSNKYPVGMYCIVIDRSILGQAIGAVSTTTAPLGYSSRASPSPAFTVFMVDNPSGGGLADKNKQSIVNVALWKDTKEVSHYSAGDADWIKELYVLKWLSELGTNPPPPDFRVANMKLSHHGAASSTPTRLVDDLKPINIIVSAGDQAGHQHPRPEVIFYIYAWLQVQNRTGEGQNPMYAMMFPFYAIPKYRESEFFEPLFTPTPIKSKEYRHLTDYASTGYTKLPKSYPVFRALIEKPDGTNVEAKFLKKLLDMYTPLAARAPPVINIHEQFKLWAQTFLGLNILTNMSERQKFDMATWISLQVEEMWKLLSPMYVTDDERKRTEMPYYIAIRSTIPNPTSLTNHEVRWLGDWTQAEEAFLARDVVMGTTTDTTTPIELIPFPRALKDNLIESIIKSGSTDTSRAMRLARSLASDDGEHVITEGDADPPALAIIVALLHTQKITLEKTPEPNSSTKLVATDEWVEWFQSALSATEMTVQTDTDGDIKGLTVALDAATLFPNANTPQLIFSTQNFTKAAVKSDLPLELPLGVLETYSLMGFGLDATKTGGSFKSDLSTVLKYAGVKLDNPIVEFLGSQVGLTLDAQDGARNVVWFSPASSYSTTTRLQWKIDGVDRIKTKLKEFLKGAFEIPENGNVNLVTRRMSTWAPGEGNIRVTSVASVLLEVDLQILGKTFPITLDFKQGNIKVQINNKDKDVLGTIVSWLQTSMESEEIPIVAWLQKVTAGILKALIFRRITINVSNVEGQPRKVTGFKIEVEVTLVPGANENNPAPILLTYSATPSTKGYKLRGELWLSTLGLESPLLLPAYEEATALNPITSSTIEYLDLSKLDPKSTIEPPKGIPTIVGRAFVEVTDKALTIGGDIRCNPEALDPNPTVPQIALESVSLDATYTFGTGSGAGLELSLGVQVDIHPPETAFVQRPCTIKGSIIYDKGKWTLQATTTPLYGSALYSFFDPKAKDATLSLLDKLEFGGLELEYKYSNGVGSQFKFIGAIYLGDIELDLEYNYTPEEWYFAASLSARTEGATLNSIIESITGEDDILPGFVGEIGIGDKDSPAIKLLCTKKSKKKPPPTGASAAPSTEVAAPKSEAAADDDAYLIFSLSLGITLDGGKVPLRATFIQYRDLNWAEDIAPKRLLKFAVTGLPAIEVPAVGNLTQPFDEMFYMWVSTSDKSNDPKAPVPGLLEDEVNLINAALDDPRGGNGVDKLIPKENKKKPTANGGKPAAVILPGHHFVLVLKLQGKPEAILDYVFGGTKTPPASGSRALTAKADTPPAGDDPSLVPMKKQAGAISISNIGFKYKNNALSILLDAAFEMGPLSFKLIGFQLILKFTDGHTLTNPPFPDFGIDGLAVGFNKPPLTLAGMFIRLNTEEVKGYAGGIAVGFVPYLFKAAGFYGDVKKGDQIFKSVFVFAKLDGPLISVGFAEISGITLGFGYNMSMRFPTAQDVTSFPLLSGSNSFGDDLVDNFTTMLDVSVSGTPNPNAWFSIRKDSFWAAAGLKVAAFEILSVDAVLAVEWNPEVKIGIFGIAVADFPKGGSSSIKCHIELGISAVIDLGQGVMKLEAQLSPNSHLFDPNCRLTGGFALYYWFDGKYANKNLIGDWVFTVGGYHRAYKKPDHYPNPPRLGLSWDVGGALKITGEAYFAITPKCCMFGGRLMATITLGPLSAWFEAFADFLINYKPFYFMADGGISVGVSCKVDLLIVSFTVKVSIGATLHLEGPPLCGRVHVNFYIVAFDINFGPQPGESKALDFRQFYMLVRQVETLPNAAVGADGFDLVDQSAHLFSCISGLLTDVKKPTTQPGDAWKVKGGIFGLQITSRVAISKAHQPITQVLEDDADLPEGAILESKKPVYARPMKIQNELTSELKIKIKRRKDDGGPRSLMAEEEIPTDIPDSWGIRPIYVSVPAAVWGAYSTGTDARAGGNNSPGLLDGANSIVTEMMGVELGSPEPVIADDHIPKFSAKESMEAGVNEQGSEPEFQKFESSNPNWAPADTAAPEDRWQQVPEIWGSKVEQQKAVLQSWSDAMGWSVEDDFKDFGVPELLLQKERFLNRYLEAPMITVA